MARTKLTSRKSSSRRNPALRGEEQDGVDEQDHSSSQDNEDEEVNHQDGGEEVAVPQVVSLHAAAAPPPVPFEVTRPHRQRTARKSCGGTSHLSKSKRLRIDYPQYNRGIARKCAYTQPRRNRTEPEEVDLTGLDDTEEEEEEEEDSKLAPDAAASLPSITKSSPSSRSTSHPKLWKRDDTEREPADEEENDRKMPTFLPTVQSSSYRIAKADPDKDGPEPMQIEFKFTIMQEHSYPDFCDVNGVIYVPLLQDPDSGIFRIPPHDYHVNGTLFDGFDKSTSTKSQKEKEDFIGCLTRDVQGNAILRLGYRFDSKKSTLVKITNKTKSDELRTWFRMDEQEGGVDPDADPNDEQAMNLRSVSLDKWAHKAGGNLTFINRPSFMGDNDASSLALYTVLSENQPHAAAGWEEQLEALLPKRDASWDEAKAKRGVEEYKKFLKLKITLEDYDSKLFAPSPLIDFVWHAHVAFNDRYIRDVKAYTAEVLDKEHCDVETKLLQHCPFLAKDSRERYKRTLVDLRSEEGGGESLDEEFWPSPDSVFGQEEQVRVYRTGGGCC